MLKGMTTERESIEQRKCWGAVTAGTWEEDEVDMEGVMVDEIDTMIVIEAVIEDMIEEAVIEDDMTVVVEDVVIEAVTRKKAGRGRDEIVPNRRKEASQKYI